MCVCVYFFLKKYALVEYLLWSWSFGMEKLKTEG